MRAGDGAQKPGAVLPHLLIEDVQGLLDMLNVLLS